MVAEIAWRAITAEPRRPEPRPCPSFPRSRSSASASSTTWSVARSPRSTVHDVRSVRRHLAGPADFVHRLEGRTVVGASRRGKYLWLQLDRRATRVLCHLGMSGQFLIADAGRAAAAAPAHHAGPRRRAASCDSPTSASSAGCRSARTAPSCRAEIAHIARDPLDPLFDPAEFAARIRKRQTGVKRAILDQTLISGVGNIYADESLWRTPLHYARNTRHLRDP